MHAQELSLFQLNNIVKEAIKTCFPERYWVRAELSEVKESNTGHCYVEFVEKENRSGNMIAKARGSIWANRWRLLKPFFEEETHQRFLPGIKVLVEVSVEFHELYGYSLVVNDIDPNYTVGDMARNRAEILKRLQEEGILNMNKELPIPLLPNRIAIISSETAAGYGDFMHQLNHNPSGYVFYTHLFPAVMQGAQTEPSIIEALDKIYQHKDLFDMVVLIRGGGATSDLNSFDTYPLAMNCVQFPLPLIVGIGHERDETVLDSLAKVRVKTPTAAAEFLISTMDQAATKVAELQETIKERVQTDINNEMNRIKLLTKSIPELVKNRINIRQMKLDFYAQQIKIWAPMQIKQATKKIDNLAQIIELTSPETLLKKGYSLTLQGGKVVKSIHSLKRGDRVTTLFKDGKSESIITDLDYNPTKKI